MTTQYLELTDEADGDGRNIVLLGVAIYDGEPIQGAPGIDNRVWLGADGSLWESAGRAHSIWNRLDGIGDTSRDFATNGDLLDAAAEAGNQEIRSRLHRDGRSVADWFRRSRRMTAT